MENSLQKLEQKILLCEAKGVAAIPWRKNITNIVKEIQNQLYLELEESTQEYEFARTLYYDNEEITKFRFYLLTDAYNKQRSKTIKEVAIRLLPLPSSLEANFCFSYEFKTVGLFCRSMQGSQAPPGQKDRSEPPVPRRIP